MGARQGGAPFSLGIGQTRATRYTRAMTPPRRIFFALCPVLLLAAGPALPDGIEITGDVSMGLMGGSGPSGTMSPRPMTDLDLQIRLSRTTDSGLTFALEIDLDDLESGVATPSPDIPRRR